MTKNNFNYGIHNYKYRFRKPTDDNGNIIGEFFEHKKTGEKIEGMRNINKWVNELVNKNAQLMKENIYLKEQLIYRWNKDMKVKIMLSSPMQGKTDEEIKEERDKMTDLLLKYYNNNCQVIDSVINDYGDKTDLECFAESIAFMSEVDVLAMGHEWEKARGCKLEHDIAFAYHLPIIYVELLEKEITK